MSDGVTNEEQAKLDKQKDLETNVPFLLYKVGDPNMRTISDEYLKEMPYSKWRETKFFKSEQIQEVICTEYPDSKWTIDEYNRKFLMEDLKNVFKRTIKKEKNTNF